MFDQLLDLDALAGADEAQLVAAIAELTGRSCYDDPDRSRWACDGWDAVAAQVGAAMDISHSKASGQMYLAQALRDRPPKVAALFADGLLGAALVSGIAWHTTLIDDAHTLAAVDTALASDAVHYGPLSATKTAQAIDAVVEAHDPAALRCGRRQARSRDVVIGHRDTDKATTPLWGRLYAHHAHALDRRLLAMAHSVCDDDPRTIAQRRADALGALAAGADTLACAQARWAWNPVTPRPGTTGPPNVRSSMPSGHDRLMGAGTP
jgi:hypothetical protein